MPHTVRLHRVMATTGIAHSGGCHGARWLQPRGGGAALRHGPAKAARLGFCEVERMPAEFNAYPKLASSNFLFGDRKKLKKLKLDKLAGTLFEPCDEVAEVELVRNLLIHDGLLDDIPKAMK